MESRPSLSGPTPRFRGGSPNALWSSAKYSQTAEGLSSFVRRGSTCRSLATSIALTGQRTLTRRSGREGPAMRAVLAGTADAATAAKTAAEATTTAGPENEAVGGTGVMGSSPPQTGPST